MFFYRRELLSICQLWQRNVFVVFNNIFSRYSRLLVGLIA